MDMKYDAEADSDSRFLDGIGDYHGKPCGSGCNFVTITPNGAVYRCGSMQCLGNLFGKNVRLLNGPKPCDASYCPCFCEKYTSAQFLPEAIRFRYADAGNSGYGRPCANRAGLPRWGVSPAQNGAIVDDTLKRVHG